MAKSRRIPAAEWLGFVRTGEGALDFEIVKGGAIDEGEVRIVEVMREERLSRKAESEFITREILPKVGRDAINDAWATLGDSLTGAVAVEVLANDISQRFNVDYSAIAELLHDWIDRAGDALHDAYGDLDSDNPDDWKIPSRITGVEDDNGG